jgi:hypothetical protein
MAWEDRTSCEVIEMQLGFKEWSTRNYEQRNEVTNF